MKTALLVFCLLTAALTSMAASQVQAERTVIAGRVLGLGANDPRVIAVNFCDPLQPQNEIVIPLTAGGEFVARYPMCFEQNITVTYAGQLIHVFIAPADSVFLTIDLPKFSQADFTALHFRGSKDKFNNQFAPFCDFFYRLTPPKLDLRLEPKALAQLILQEVAQEMVDVRNYAQKNKIKQRIVLWAKRDLIYQKNHQIKNYKPGNYQARKALLTDEIFELSSHHNFQTKLFATHLQSVWQALIEGDVRMEEFRASEDEAGCIKRAIQLICNTFPRSTMRDVMLYQCLYPRLAQQPDLYQGVPSGIFVNDLIRRKLEVAISTPSRVSIYNLSSCVGDIIMDCNGNLITTPKRGQTAKRFMDSPAIDKLIKR
ncbi:MAG: hypothetical protein RSC35_06530 [Mucinivorans sp.]